MIANYKDLEKFNDYDKEIISKLEHEYIGKYGFYTDTLEGVELNNERVYGFKWNLLKMYLDKQFLLRYSSDERIQLINNMIIDMLKCNYCDKGIEMIHNTFLTKGYIDKTIENNMFQDILKNNLNISEERNKLIKLQ